MTARPIITDEQASSCYFRTTVDHPNRKALIQICEPCNGDGYRYDHAHASGLLRDTLRGCSYVHETRTGTDRLTDHSALTVKLALAVVGLLPVTDPTRAEESAPALF